MIGKPDWGGDRAHSVAILLVNGAGAFVAAPTLRGSDPGVRRPGD